MSNKPFLQDVVTKAPCPGMSEKERAMGSKTNERGVNSVKEKTINKFMKSYRRGGGEGGEWKKMMT